MIHRFNCKFLYNSPRAFPCAKSFRLQRLVVILHAAATLADRDSRHAPPRQCRVSQPRRPRLAGQGVFTTRFIALFGHDVAESWVNVTTVYKPAIVALRTRC